MVVSQSETELSDIDEEEDDTDEDLPLVTENFKRIDRKPQEGDYVMVGFETKKLEILYTSH